MKKSNNHVVHYVFKVTNTTSYDVLEFFCQVYKIYQFLLSCYKFKPKRILIIHNLYTKLISNDL